MSRLYGFAYSERALAFLNTIPPKFRKQIVAKITALAGNPHPAGHKIVQGMKNGEEIVYRIRSGDYRMLYVVRTDPSHIVVLDIDHRKDVYR
jgi:mRNA interferase RelE/StbE